MNNFEQPIFEIREIRKIEDYIQNELGISSYLMMQNAAKASFEALLKKTKDKTRKILVFCGAGNNGGDGFLVAKLAKIYGFEVLAIRVGNFDKQSSLCQKTAKEALESGVKIISDNDSLVIEQNSIIIDAIFGIGLKGDVRERELAIITKINQFKNNNQALVMSIDIPSGLCANTGQIFGSAVIADFTITFLGLKTGLFLAEGKICNKEIIFSDLNIDYSGILTSINAKYFKLDDDLTKLIKPRKIDANKGDFGHVLIVGGDYNMGGSVIMAAEAAFRAGAGKVSVLSRKEHFLPLIARLPNVMTCQANSSNDLIKIAIDKTVIVFGMGFSSSNWSKELFDFFINYNPAIPKIIDADGLNILATKQSNYNLENTILTPHPKEAATLLATTTKEIQEDRDLAIKKLQQKYQATIVLKGNNSLILGKEQKLYLCPHGNPGMATAGSGDVLSGIIAAIKASNNLDNILAASLAVNIHAKAGDLYAKINGQKGMMATDLIGYISKATNY
jgi:hydroxyethylthiazole kinase-like uncharacterized protein yjeF